MWIGPLYHEQARVKFREIIYGFLLSQGLASHRVLFAKPGKIRKHLFPAERCEGIGNQGSVKKAIFGKLNDNPQQALFTAICAKSR